MSKCTVMTLAPMMPPAARRPGPPMIAPVTTLRRPRPRTRCRLLHAGTGRHVRPRRRRGHWSRVRRWSGRRRLVAGIVGENHGLRLQAHRSVAAKMATRYRRNLAVNLCARGNQGLAVLKNVGDNAGAKLVAALAHRCRQAIHQADANDSAFAESAGRQWARVNNVAVGIACDGR